MAEDIWKPHVTVAAMVEQDDKFLLVKEKIKGEILYNQPAGHLEPGESLIEAVVRETMEETQYDFTATALQGIYRFVPNASSDSSYIRLLFRGTVGLNHKGVLDEGIVSVEWMSYEEIKACRHQHRSPLVLQCVEDCLNNAPFPLDIISQQFA
jgi:8-oxo-dGTP pyrophosphatase MutT (NUDIX family)